MRLLNPSSWTMSVALAEVRTGMTVAGVKALAVKRPPRLYRGAEYMVVTAEGKSESLCLTISWIPVLTPSFVPRRRGKSATVRSLSLMYARVIRIRTGEEDDAALSDIADSLPSHSLWAANRRLIALRWRRCVVGCKPISGRQWRRQRHATLASIRPHLREKVSVGGYRRITNCDSVVCCATTPASQLATAPVANI